ncbi:N-6 DNA methylase [Clostridium botulinum]|nr:hypothetical protein [Clostridium botulinum]NFD32177.1 hypothetical protein [Clostridium botulinum]NFD58084.1 hypothetical protein [Clostridium botulinum]NFD99897.1 hypothetical protein [Clostridium botulinum]
MHITKVKSQTKKMIDDLKAICSNFGLGNASSEYKIITEVFLYKFLNDKFIHEAREVVPKFSDMSASEVEKAMTNMSEDDYELMLMNFGAATARLKTKHFISHLFSNKDKDGFHELFDETLIGIANYNIEIFSVQTGGQSKIRLFDAISQYVVEEEKKDRFCRAIIDKLANFSFDRVSAQKYDFFADIFEYLIKDYNKDFGKYAEYYTPHSIASIIAKIMVPDGPKNVTIYDPAAGSGTLVLALAHEIGESNCTIFTQDISQKSNEFLRLNLILNNLVHSLPNIVHEDTLINPRHLNAKKDRLMTFDYIVSNPPFNMDFSENRNALAGEKYKKRFFAGVPNVPTKNKKNMAIYLMFIQHIIFSLSKGGKAAIVVPTGFLTKDRTIEKNIRSYLIENKYLKGIVSMPPNIFATTPTGVSILFIDTGVKNERVLLFDATGYGEKSKEIGKNKKTILTDKNAESIIDVFNNNKEIDQVSVYVSVDKIIEKDYSLSPGQYFKRKIVRNNYTVEKYHSLLDEKLKSIKLYFSQEIEEISRLIFHMWFLQFDFPDIDGKPYAKSGGEMKYSKELMMDIPIGWKVKSILSVCDIVDCLHSKKPDYFYESDECYLLQLDNLTDNGKIDVRNKYFISKADYEIWSKKIEIRENDFIVTNAGRAGAIGMVPKGVKCAIGRNFTAIRSRTVNPYYLRQFFDSPYMDVQVLSNLDEGSFFKSFNVKSIKKLNILLPPEEVMVKYLEIMQPIIYNIVNGVSESNEKAKLIELLKPQNRFSGEA